MNWNTEPLLACPSQVDAAMRTELGDIAAASQVLLRGAGEKQRRYLALINRAAFRCNQILYEEELARRLDDEDELRAVYAEMDLADWCGKASEKAAKLLEGAGVKLSFACREKVILTMADRELLDEMLYALISNAVKAGGAGRPVSVSLERRGDNALLTVSDEGGGFSDQALERLLGDGALEPDLTPGAGAGLGLRLCRAIAETHGGLLMLESAPGQGARCAASLPLRQGRDTHTSIGSPQADGGFDRALAALSGVLPPESFCPER